MPYPTKKLGSHLYELFSVLVIVLLLAHGIFDDIFRIDNTTILLLVILILLPYLPLIKKIKFGDFEAEISSEEIKNIEVQSQNIPKSEDKKIKSNKVEELIEVAQSDHILALAKARIEIETRVRSLGEIYLKLETANSLNLRRAIAELSSAGLLEQSLVALLNDIVAVANRAIHGEYVSEQNAMKLVELAGKAISELDNVVIGRAMKSVSVEVITPGKVEDLREGHYTLKTVVPYVKNPEIRTYHLNQSELDAFLERYDEVAEFIVSLERKVPAHKT